LKTDACW